MFKLLRRKKRNDIFTHVECSAVTSSTSSTTEDDDSNAEHLLLTPASLPSPAVKPQHQHSQWRYSLIVLNKYVIK